MLAHQFAEPLGAIAANAQTLQLLLGSRTDLHPDVNAAIAAIESDVERAASLMQATRLLYYPNTIAVAPTDIAVPLRLALDRTAPVAVRAGVALRARIDESLWADGEAVLLEQAFLNLLLNAVEAAATATHVDRAVDVTARVSASAVRVVVSDTGPGFSPEALRRAGEAFFTTKGPGNLGVGLALVRKVARAHGATLTVANGERGAKTVLSLPTVAARPVAARSPERNDVSVPAR